MLFGAFFFLSCCWPWKWTALGRQFDVKIKEGIITAITRKKQTPCIVKTSLAGRYDTNQRQGTRRHSFALCSMVHKRNTCSKCDNYYHQHSNIPLKKASSLFEIWTACLMQIIHKTFQNTHGFVICWSVSDEHKLFSLAIWLNADQTSL